MLEKIISGLKPVHLRFLYMQNKIGSASICSWSSQYWQQTEENLVIVRPDISWYTVPYYHTFTRYYC